MLGAAWVRTVNVSGKRYLSVVETQPNGSIKVLQSFGQHSIENWLKANQYATSYNNLRDLRQQAPTTDGNTLLKAALAIFGVILGAAIIEELFKD
jgi:hypothetical protein